MGKAELIERAEAVEMLLAHAEVAAQRLLAAFRDCGAPADLADVRLDADVLAGVGAAMARAAVVKDMLTRIPAGAGGIVRHVGGSEADLERITAHFARGIVATEMPHA